MNGRAAGLLLHPTSLPADAGGIEASARRFFAWAEAAGISTWQILPVGPPGEGFSPYAALSAFAGDPAWFGEAGAAAPEGFAEFCGANAVWLDDWALFAALKDAHRGLPWFAWDEALRRRDPNALAQGAVALAESVSRHRRAQHGFMVRWSALREAARAHGVTLLGDVPIYPALDSADVWAHQDLFHLDAEGAPTKVAGVPPDYFSATGQLWGNPVYRWDRLAETGYAWWIERLRRGMALHDALRLDHFRGFAGYWAVPADADTAEEGAWEPGPGPALFDAVRAALHGLPFVAEDLGVITDDVTALRKSLGLPGMRVLQFGFDVAESDHAPHRLPPDVVVYTGTHDNDTTRGWFTSLDPPVKARVLAAVGGTTDEISWNLIGAAYASAAELAVAPLQDVLGLGSEARMNVPGVARGNWRWRAPADAFTEARAARLRRLAGETGRGC
jgi:4-alpha-glucanotransferase